MHPKARKRLLVLVGSVGLVAVLGGGAFTARKLAIRAEYRKLRVDGFAALKEHRNAEAFGKFWQYLGRNPDDAEVLSALATARLAMPSPDGRNSRDAVNALQRAVNIESSWTDDRARLASLLLEINRLPEAVDQATRVLAVRPKDPTMLGVRALAEQRMNHLETALSLAKEWTEVDLSDLRAPWLYLVCLQQSNKPQAEIQKVADDLQKRATSAVVKRVTHLTMASIRGDRTEMEADLRALARETPQSALEAGLIAQQLEVAGLGEESAIFLARAAELGLLPTGKLIPARRLSEMQRFDLLQTLLADLDISSEETPVELIGLRGIAQMNMGDPAGTEAAIARLKVVGSNSAKAWTLILEDSLSHSTAKPDEVVKIMTAALADDASAPLLSYVLAETYVRTGQTDEAVAIFNNLARRLPAWSLPLEGKAQCLAGMNQIPPAMDAATEARRRRPLSVSALTTYGNIWAMAVRAGLRNDKAELNQFLEALSDKLPGNYNTAPARITALCSVGKVDEARKVVEEVLTQAKAKPSPSWAPLLLQIAAAAGANNLGNAEQILKQTEEFAGVSALSSVTRALVLTTEGKTEAAVGVFETAFAADVGARKSREWLFARARLMDAVGSDKSYQAWVDAADAFPDDTAIQRAAMSSGSIRGDVAFRGRLLERLRKQLGQNAASFRLAEGWVVLDGKPDQKDVQRVAESLGEAVRQLPGSVEARFLLARALELQGTTGGAIEQLRAGLKISPESTPVALFLAELLQKRGDFAAAGVILDHAASQKYSDDAQRRSAASLLAQQGDPNKALTMLEGSTNRKDSVDPLLPLLYRQRNELPRAEAEARKVVAAKADVGNIRMLAEILRAQGKVKEALDVLDELANLKLEPGVKELALTDFHVRFSEIQEALASAKLCTEKAPTNYLGWQSLAVVQIASGDTASAVETLTKAGKMFPDQQAFTTPLAILGAIKQSGTDPILRPVVMGFCQHPSDPALEEAVRTSTSGLPSEGGPGGALVRIQQLEQRYPLSQPVQMLAIRRLLQFGIIDEAADIAARAAQAFPMSSEAPALAASSYYKRGDYEKAVTYARLWRTRSGVNPFPADMALTEALLKLNQYDEVLSVMAPYLRDFKQDPQTYTLSVFRTAEAYTLAGRQKDAVALLAPLLGENPAAWSQWLEYALTNMSPQMLPYWANRAASVGDGKDASLNFQVARCFATALTAANDPTAAAARAKTSALAHAPGMSPTQLILAALQHDQADEYGPAESLYREALAALQSGGAKNASNASIVANNLSMVLIRANHSLPDAVALAERAVESSPEQAAFHDTLATAHQALQHYAEAQKSLSKAIDLEPATPEWSIHLAEVQLASGDAATARKTVESLKVIPTGSYSTAVLGRLRKVEAALAGMKK